MKTRNRTVSALAAIVPIFCAMSAFSTIHAADAAEPSQNPVGAAIALSVEPAAIGYCRDRDMNRAVTCAMEECLADGGLNCVPVTWCHVAGAAGVMFGYKYEFGLSQLYAACGGFSRAGIEAVLQAKCATDAGAGDCALVRFWDVEGVELSVAD